MNYTNHPLKLNSARAWRTYIGGSQIDAIHGLADHGDSQFPEEWIMSTVSARNAGREDFPDEGQSFLDGTQTSLKELVLADPLNMLGKSHCQIIGDTTGVLVKLIDAGERLTIQAHPSREKAKALFNSPFGKTECWHVVGGRQIDGMNPCIYMGFREGITREYWKEVFDKQDISAMLNCLHCFDVQPGETYLIKGGVPHAIGAGCLLVEIQEPTDYTVRTERITPAGLHIADFMIHQGLGFEKMFDTFEYDGISKSDAYSSWCLQGKVLKSSPEYTIKEIVGYDDTPCFRLLRYDINTQCRINCEGIFSGMYILSGEGELICDGNVEQIAGGNQFFVPAASNPFTIRNSSKTLTLFRCFGPNIII